MGPPAFAHPCGPGAELVLGLVLLDDRRGNTAGLAHLVSAVPRPCPDFRAPLPARGTYRPVALTLRAWLVYSRVQFLSMCRGYLARLWRGDGWVMRRTSTRTTPKPRSVSLFQGSLGCPPRSRGPVAGPPGSCSAPSSTPNSNGDAALLPPRRAANRSSRFGMRKRVLRRAGSAGNADTR